MNSYFPIFLNMKDRQVQVFGGGNIALRRIKALLEFGAKVSAAAPEMNEDLQKLAVQQGNLQLEYRTYCPGELGKAEIVLAVTDDTVVNTMIFEECRQKHIWVNVASNKEQCDFFFPGIASQGEITIGVTAGGKNHQKAAKVTKKIRRQLLEWENGNDHLEDG